MEATVSARCSRVWTRAALLALAVLALQGSSTCIYCSGDCDDEDEDEDDFERELIVLPPLLDPLGRPLTGPRAVRLQLR